MCISVCVCLSMSSVCSPTGTTCSRGSVPVIRPRVRSRSSRVRSVTTSVLRVPASCVSLTTGPSWWFGPIPRRIRSFSPSFFHLSLYLHMFIWSGLSSDSASNCKVLWIVNCFNSSCANYHYMPIVFIHVIHVYMFILFDEFSSSPAYYKHSFG